MKLGYVQIGEHSVNSLNRIYTHRPLGIHVIFVNDM